MGFEGGSKEPEDGGKCGGDEIHDGNSLGKGKIEERSNSVNPGQNDHIPGGSKGLFSIIKPRRHKYTKRGNKTADPESLAKEHRENILGGNQQVGV